MNDTFADFLSRVRRRLKGPLPGEAAQLRMAPIRDNRADRISIEGRSGTRAAVAIILYPRDAEPYTLLTLRSTSLYHHAGQISFPGGRQEAGETALETARREAMEEVGVCPEGLDLLGELTPLFVPPSGHIVHPFVFGCDRRPDFRQQENEVSGILEVPVEHILRASSMRKEIWNVRGEDIPVPFYQWKDHSVWGATAMMLSELADVVQDLQ